LEKAETNGAIKRPYQPRNKKKLTLLIKFAVSGNILSRIWVVLENKLYYELIFHTMAWTKIKWVDVPIFKPLQKSKILI